MRSGLLQMQVREPLLHEEYADPSADKKGLPCELVEGEAAYVDVRPFFVVRGEGVSFFDDEKVEEARLQPAYQSEHSE